MKHSEFIKRLPSGKGKYAETIGISRSFLSQIQAGTSKTPRRIYIKVIQETNGLVTLEDLVSEEIVKGN